MQEYKIVFTGNMGAGKTTAIGMLSDIEVLSTDVTNTAQHENSKSLTTVGIDYGRLTLSDDLSLSIYGTPGQERFQFMWKIAAKGALGVIVLIDSTAKNALHDMNMYVDFYKNEGIDVIVVGVTHTDHSSSLPFEIFIDSVSNTDYVLPVFAIDARDRNDILFITEVLIAEIEASL
ncbi:GTP-binding protein [Gammaproteobacteria bacterium]|nr:GTP-binding protein [Gammaproteobacteria bacterium]